jgi:hypothetical protein
VNASGQVRRLRRFAPLRTFFALPFLALVLVFASLAAGAARSDAAAGNEGQVAEGLQKIQGIAADVVKNTGHFTDQATKLSASIEPVWKTIEDTVRANDKNTYIALEDAFEKLQAGAKSADAKKAGQASDAIAAAVKSYGAKHPAAAASPAPSTPPAARSAEAAGSGAVKPAPAAPAPAAPAQTPRSAEAAAGAANSAPSAASPGTPGAAPAPDAGLARTGPDRASALTALAGTAFALGGLALLAGARRRTSMIA